jgi:hypothetical protein
MKIQKLKMTACDYTSGRVITESLNYNLKVTNFLFTRNRLVAHLMGNRRRHAKFIRIHRIFQDNRDNFQELFGKQSFVYQGEANFYCWYLDIDGLQLLVLTAKGVGTCYEVVKKAIDSEYDIDKFINFLKYICKHIK